MKASTKAIRFLESLSIPEGPKAGQAVILLDDDHTKDHRTTTASGSDWLNLYAQTRLTR